MVCRAIIFTLPGASNPLNLRPALHACGIESTTAHSEREVLELVNRFSPRCATVVCGAAIDDQIARLAERLHQLDAHCPVIFLASAISLEMALRAMRSGIVDLLDSADSLGSMTESLRALFDRCWPLPCLGTPGQLISGPTLIGHSPAIGQVRDQIARVAASDANVLITGESGTGKELAAELIHRNSGCCGPMVTINCAAVPEPLLESELFGHERGAFTGAVAARIGKVEHADRGTLFLDEVGDMSLLAQAKMLRAIESRVVQRLGSNADVPVQVRLLAATNQDLEQLTQEKKFRQDLYYRLNVVRLTLPPLRDRLEDIPDLTEHILYQLASQKNAPLRRIESDLVRRLQMHSWPGNVRELRNVLECILVFTSSRSIGISDLPDHIRQTLRSSDSSYGDERSRILGALNSTQWNRSKAAEILHCSRMTLYRKMVKLALPSQPN